MSRNRIILSEIGSELIEILFMQILTALCMLYTTRCWLAGHKIKIVYELVMNFANAVTNWTRDLCTTYLQQLHWKIEQRKIVRNYFWVMGDSDKRTSFLETKGKNEFFNLLQWNQNWGHYLFVSCLICKVFLSWKEKSRN